MTEAELLFTEILNCGRIYLYLNKDLPLSEDKSHIVSSVLKRRILGEPLEYILGETEFMGLEFKVNRNVFIPRPETEILVETVINMVHSKEFRVHGSPAKAGSRLEPSCMREKFLPVPACPAGRRQAGKVQGILELGTGSGCIAISLAKLLSDVHITATDISANALDTAEQNALLNNVKINFLLSDLFNNLELQTMNYELIVSNPPYIPTAGIEILQPEIKYEPYIALDGGKDGLNFYRKIIRDSTRYLKENGSLIMEMGFNQRDAVEDIFQESGNFEIIEVIKDYNNIDRVIVAHRLKCQ